MNPIDADEARTTADEILSRSEFQEEQPTLVDRALDWIFDRIGELFGAVLGSGGGYWFGYLLIILALVAAAYFVWRFFPRRRLARSGDGYTVRHETIVRRSRAEWLAEAAAAEAEGEWSKAVRARYRALTAGLADRAVLRSEPSTTAGEHREAYAAVGDRTHAAVFEEATTRYEEVWFGGDEADGPDSRQLADIDRSMMGDDQ